MWHLLVDSTSGRLVSESAVAPERVPVGHEVITVPDRPDLRASMWDAGTRAFVTRPPKVLVDRLDDLVIDPDFMAVWNTLNQQRRLQLRAALIKLLGRNRFRNPSETMEVG